MITKITKNPYLVNQKGNKFYKYIMIDLDDKSIDIRRLNLKIEAILKQAKIKEKLKIYGFSSIASSEPTKSGLTVLKKPVSPEDAFELLRHMADEHPKTTRVKE